jgi:hypothetical protein
MKKAAPTFELILPKTGAAVSVPLHNQFHFNGISSAVQGVCWLAMAGLQLAEEKKKLEHGEWEPWVEKNCAFTLRTAQRYMALADGVKARALKNDSGVVFRLLEKAPAELDDKERGQLFGAVKKLTDGETVAELYAEFGITKKKAAAGLKGKKRKHTPGGADVNDPAEVASDLWKPHIDFLENDGLDSRTWKDLPQKELTRLKENVADLARLLKGGAK